MLFYLKNEKDRDMTTVLDMCPSLFFHYKCRLISSGKRTCHRCLGFYCNREQPNCPSAQRYGCQNEKIDIAENRTGFSITKVKHVLSSKIMQNPAIERKKSEASLIGNRLPDRTKEPRRSIYNYDSSLLESQTRIYFF